MNHHYTGIAAFLCAAAILAGSVSVRAEGMVTEPKKKDVTLPNGKVLHDAYILDTKPNGVTVGYKEGCSFFRYSDMSLDLQKKFNYDPVKSARYERKLEDQKKVEAKAESARKASEAKAAAEAEKRFNDQQIAAQQQRVRKLELQLEESKKRQDTMEKHIEEDRRDVVGLASVGSTRVTIDSPWGYGGRVRTNTRSAAVVNRLIKQEDTLNVKRDNLAQDNIDLQLRLEAAKRSLDMMVNKDQAAGK